MTCEGSCEPHAGEVQRVHVWFGAHDWGEFWYCATAQEEDTRRGLTVNILKQKGQP
jgi:hypothetical protein